MAGPTSRCVGVLLGLACSHLVSGHPDIQPSHLDSLPTQDEKWGPTQAGHGFGSHWYLADQRGRSFPNGFGVILVLHSGPHSFIFSVSVNNA